MLDIIIPSYNGEDYILRTLESIQKQSFTTYRCIIIDDNSKDQTPQIIDAFCQKDTRFELHRKPYSIPKGAGFSRQYGYELSDNPYVYWFDSDDIMLEDNLQVKMNHLLSHPETDYVLSPQQRISYDLTELGSVNRVEVTDDIVNDYFIGKTAFYVQSTIWKREALKRANMTWHAGSIDDWDFNMQAIHQELNRKVLTTPYVWYVKTPNSIMRRHQNYSDNEIRDELKFKYKWFKIAKLNKTSLTLLQERLIKIIKRASINNKLKATAFLSLVVYRKLWA